MVYISFISRKTWNISFRYIVIKRVKILSSLSLLSPLVQVLGCNDTYSKLRGFEEMCSKGKHLTLNLTRLNPTMEGMTFTAMIHVKKHTCKTPRKTFVCFIVSQMQETTPPRKKRGQYSRNLFTFFTIFHSIVFYSSSMYALTNWKVTTILVNAPVIYGWKNMAAFTKNCWKSRYKKWDQYRYI